MRKLLVLTGVTVVVATGATLAFTHGTSHQFTLSTDEAGATWQCASDGGALSSCSSPESYMGLAPGQHTVSLTSTFTVRSPAQGDTQPPSEPTDLNVTNVTKTGLTFNWSASTDNVGVMGYVPSRNRDPKAQVTGTSKTFSGMTCGTTYKLGVQAVDAAGNKSTEAMIQATTAACSAGDTTPPRVSVTGPMRTASGNVNVMADAFDNVGVAGVQFTLDGANLGAADTRSPYGVSWDTTTATNGSHTLTAVAKDAAGNTTTSAVDTVTVSNSTSGLQVPSWGPTMPTTGTYLGAFVNPDGNPPQTRQEVTTLETQLGRKLGIGSHYRGWTDTSFPDTSATRADESWDVANGRIPMISWGDTGFSGNILNAINNGSQDSVIRATAASIAAFGHPVFLRLFWEMNGDWEPYSETVASTPGTTDGGQKYITAWRHIHDIFHQAGASNAAFVWCPNANDVPQTAANHWTNYYPGDAYVDWVCADGYNRASPNWRSFQTIFQSIYNAYPQKPFLVGETSSVESGGSKAQWITDMGTAVKTSMSRIRAIVWFDRGPQSGSPEDWRIDSASSSLDAFTAVGADPYFNPTPK